MKKEIITTLSNIILNVFSDDVSEKKQSVMEKVKLFFFEKRIKRRMTSFCQGKDGTVLTSGRFETFLKYHKPIEKIYAYILDCGGDSIATKTFINQLLEETKNSYNDGTHKITVLDEAIIKEFFVFVYQEYYSYIAKGLSSEQKLMTTTISHAMDMQTEIITDSLEQVKQLIDNRNILNNPEEIIKVYDVLGIEIQNGNLEKVHDIMPVFSEKNSDIDLGIRIKMNIVSDYKCLDIDILDAWKKINSNYISNDIVRFLILCWIKEKNKLLELYNLMKESELKSIILHICEDKRDQFIKIETKRENYANIYNYELVESYPHEKWLVRRICAFWLSDNSAVNIYMALRTLLGNDLSYIEELLILEKEQEAILSTTSTTELVRTRIQDIGKVLKDMKCKIDHSHRFIKEKYYLILLRNHTILKDKEDVDIISIIPACVKDNAEIKSLIIQYRIDKDEVSEEEVFEFCKEKGEYWLYNNFLIKYSGEPYKILALIEKHIELLKLDVHIYLMYVQAVRICNGIKQAIVLMEEYKEYHKDYIEFWIELLRLLEKKDELLDSIYNNWKEEKLKYINLSSEIDFAELLVDSGKYENAMQVVKKLETLENISPRVLKLKAKLLVEEKQLIEALNILEEIFEDYSKDSFVVDTYIVLSLNTRREVPQKIINAAIEIGTARLFMLVAVMCARSNKRTEAMNYITKSLLRSENKDADVFANYFMMNLKFSDDSTREINGIEEDTAVILESENGERIVYCIYRDDVLPQVPHLWQSAVHIYRTEAIEYGLVRKKTNDTIVINEKQYIISEIVPIDCYLVRLCIAKLIELNVIKQFTVEMKADGEVDVEHLTNELLKYMPQDEESFGWLENYKDLSNWPLPFWLLQRNVRVNAVQLIMAFMKDNSIIIRELYGVESVKGEKFILSFASTIMMYMLGMSAQNLSEKNVIIPESLKRTIIDMCEEIIEDNDKDTVSAIGVTDNQLYMTVATEDEKVELIKFANELKLFVDELKSHSNSRDIKGSIDDRIDLLDTFGISDYDALSLAQSSGAILVTGEVTIMCLTQIKGFGIRGMGVLNFLVEIHTEVYELLTYMRKMIEYGFLISLTKESYIYIQNKYSELEDDDAKEQCMEKWIDYLSKPNDMSEEYREIFVRNMITVYKVLVKEEQIDFTNPIGKNFMFFFMKYNKLSLKVEMHNDGNVDIIAVKDET